uniref:Uncharacterized protein n=1 Tax=Siphoviridae sp. cthSp75 TaxID=2826424 RepID=A0A8S5NDR4_9CAUD|nr:MAG TPA: hypothetical protein [Siphoviridae sp. cthSp75]
MQCFFNAFKSLIRLALYQPPYCVYAAFKIHQQQRQQQQGGIGYE